MNTTTTTTWRTATRAISTALVASALGGAAVSASTATTSPGDPPAYCQAHLDLEAAMNGDDPAAIGPAIEAAQAVVPDELRTALQTAIDNPPAADAPPTPAFFAAYGQISTWVAEHCQLPTVPVTAEEYAFEGLPAEIEAGVTIVALTNAGAQEHEIVLFRKNDGVTDSISDLLALPEDQAMGKVTALGGAVADPGATSYLIADLLPGDYAAICFLPVGTTPEQMASGSLPDAEPHFAHGMVQEFTVVDGPVSTTGSTASSGGATGTTAG